MIWGKGLITFAVERSLRTELYLGSGLEMAGHSAMILKGGDLTQLPLRSPGTEFFELVEFCLEDGQ